MNNKDYIKELGQIRPSNEIISRTITRVKQNNELKQMQQRITIKQIILSLLAMTVFSTSTVAAYVVVTGNVDILRKIGINIVDDYEKNNQIIEENEETQNIVKGENFEAKLNSVSLASNSIILEIDLKYDEIINVQNPYIEFDNISIYMPNKDLTWGECVLINKEVSSQKMEDNSFKIIEYLSLYELNLAQGSILEAVFEEEENVDFTINIKGLYEDGKLLDSVENLKSFKFSLCKKGEIESKQEILEVEENMTFGDVDILVKYVTVSGLGNTINLYIQKFNIDINNMSDISHLDFDIYDKKGNSINVISRTDNITFGDYENGKLGMIALETQIIVDDTQNNSYNIVMKTSDKEVVDEEKIKNTYDHLLNDILNSDYVYTAEGVATLIEEIKNQEAIYQDNFGVLRIDSDDETNDECIYGNNELVCTNEV